MRDEMEEAGNHEAVTLSACGQCSVAVAVLVRVTSEVTLALLWLRSSTFWN